MFQKVNMRKSSHLIDQIWYQTQKREINGDDSNFIIIANKFSIFRQHHHYWLLFSKRRHVVLSLMSMTSVLTRTTCICAYLWHDRQRDFQIGTKTQLERAIAIRSARFDLSKLDCVYQEGIGPRHRPRHVWLVTRGGLRSWNGRQCYRERE
jgi:hypothetical protein